jgi:hypothetical protein
MDAAIRPQQFIWRTAGAVVDNIPFNGLKLGWYPESEVLCIDPGALCQGTASAVPNHAQRENGL